MPSKRNKDSDALDRLMNSLKIKLTKLTKNRGGLLIVWQDSLQFICIPVKT